MSPHLVAGYFGGSEQYARLARVLAHSAAVHCPAWTHQIGRIEPRPFQRDGHWGPSHLANTQKIDHWCTVVEALPDGAQVALLDADTLITGPLDAVWDLAFDVAYTTKAETRVPFNTGVVFVRVSPVSRAFLQAWRDRQVAMLANGRDEATRAWRRLMIGINQAALAALLNELRIDPRLDFPSVVVTTHGADLLQLRRLPCCTWNSEDACWPAFDATTRIVHVKGHLRAVVLGQTTLHIPHVARLAALWTTYEQAAMHGQPA